LDFAPKPGQLHTVAHGNLLGSKLRGARHICAGGKKTIPISDPSRHRLLACYYPSCDRAAVSLHHARVYNKAWLALCSPAFKKNNNNAGLLIRSSEPPTQWLQARGKGEKAAAVGKGTTGLLLARDGDLQARPYEPSRRWFNVMALACYLFYG
jgi:hypothetical protein